MRICLVSHEYAPFPHGGIATYHDAAARHLAAAGHEVHVVTNRAAYGRTEPEMTQRLWRRGNLTVHRLMHFDESRVPSRDATFFDLTPSHYGGPDRLWAAEAANLAAHRVATYVEGLHRTVGLDVIETPEFFAEGFYVIRRRHCGWRHCFPPVCVHGHISSRFAFGANRHAWELGLGAHRQLMRREEYCLTHADALLTPSRALMARYEQTFGERLPELRDTIPYFLDVPDEPGPLPDALRGHRRYLLCVGRLEPRKGVDVALRAFALLAADDPELELVFVGREMWHHGESIDELVEALVPAPLRARVLRPGVLPRAQVLAAVRGAAAFVHPVPWDNYPCAVLEAMAVGAPCVVSGSGGQAEMVEDGTSGLLFEAGHAEALAQVLRGLLADPDRGRALGAAAARRVREITDPQRLLARKIALFEEVIARERRAAGPALGAFDVPAALRLDDELAALPGAGMVLLDASRAEPARLRATCETLRRELAATPGWTVQLLLDRGQDADVPGGWTRLGVHERPPWLDLAPDAFLVWMRAGVRLDRGRLRHVVAQLVDTPVPCGSFAWLRPARPHPFPYAPDFSCHDLLHVGHLLPPLFAVRAEHVRACVDLAGLGGPEDRQCALLAAAAAAGRMSFQHVGEICGDWYDDAPVVTPQAQQRAVGYLDRLGLLPAEQATFGRVDEGIPPGAREREAELERVWREHMALKQMRLVRWLRGVGAFALARRLFPRSRDAIGPG